MLIGQQQDVLTSSPRLLCAVSPKSSCSWPSGWCRACTVIAPAAGRDVNHGPAHPLLRLRTVTGSRVAITALRGQRPEPVHHPDEDGHHDDRARATIRIWRHTGPGGGPVSA